MLLAMVITIMGGVWIFLNPYLTDFEDNTNWNSAVGISERFQDRIDVAGASPEGTGIRHTLALQSTYIRPIDKVEHGPFLQMLWPPIRSTYAMST